MLYVGTLITSIRRLVQFAEQFQQGMTGVERFFQVMDADVDIFDEPGAKPLQVKEGAVTFENVSFSYADDGKQVLSHINLDVKPGQNVALVGPSGGGKTTLCNLIPRFYDVDEGRILIDGQNIHDVTLKSLRDQIGFVQQDVYLFSGTVFENIQYGKPGASREEVIQAASRPAPTISSRSSPRLRYLCGRAGRQALRRAEAAHQYCPGLFEEPAIMILDEATSALDNESEKIVQLRWRSWPRAAPPLPLPTA